MRLGVVAALVMGSGLYFKLDKSLTVVVDGSPVSVRTFSLTVGQLLHRRGIHIAATDRVEPGLGAGLRDGLRIVVVHGGATPSLPIAGADLTAAEAPTLVRLIVKGQPRQVATTAVTVGDLLTTEGIRLGKNDRVSPFPSLPVTSGMTVRVTRIRTHATTRLESLTYGTDIRYDSSLEWGETRVAREGTLGQVRRTYRVRLVDGEVRRQTLLTTEVLRTPVDQVLVVGTGGPKVQTGIASWYDRTGLVAAHRWLPKGTEVTVTNVDTGATVTVIIDDRGPYVDGRIIDLSDDAFAIIAPLGAGVCQVRISW